MDTPFETKGAEAMLRLTSVGVCRGLRKGTQVR